MRQRPTLIRTLAATSIASNQAMVTRPDHSHIDDEGRRESSHKEVLPCEFSRYDNSL